MSFNRFHQHGQIIEDKQTGYKIVIDNQKVATQVTRLLNNLHYENQALMTNRFILTEEYEGNFSVPINDNTRKANSMMITEVVYELNSLANENRQLTSKLALLESVIAEYE